MADDKALHDYTERMDKADREYSEALKLCKQRWRDAVESAWARYSLERGLGDYGKQSTNR